MLRQIEIQIGLFIYIISQLRGSVEAECLAGPDGSKEEKAAILVILQAQLEEKVEKAEEWLEQEQTTFYIDSEKSMEAADTAMNTAATAAVTTSTLVPVSCQEPKSDFLLGPKEKLTRH